MSQHTALLKTVDEFVRMREITRSVKVAIKCLIAVVLVEESVYLIERQKFRHRHSIRRLRFPVRVQNFSDLATFSVDFCILYAECPPYFYFRFV